MFLIASFPRHRRCKGLDFANLACAAFHQFGLAALHLAQSLEGFHAHRGYGFISMKFCFLACLPALAEDFLLHIQSDKLHIDVPCFGASVQCPLSVDDADVLLYIHFIVYLELLLDHIGNIFIVGHIENCRALEDKTISALILVRII